MLLRIAAFLFRNPVYPPFLSHSKYITMDAHQFISNYETFVKMIGKTTAIEYQPHIRAMLEIDPTDLIQPEAMFVSDGHAIGFIWIHLFKRIFHKS